VEKGAVLAEYNQLKAIVESSDFQAKKTELITTKYANTRYGKTMAEYKSLKWKGAVLMYRLFHKESLKQKPEVASYLQLLEQVQKPEFKKENAFWKNEKRWLTTAEAAQEKRYHKLAKHADVVFYGQHTEAEVAELESYKLVWKDEFDAAMTSQWETGFVYPAGMKADHSHVSEQHADMQGQNTQVAGSVMTVLTKKQAVKAAAWHPTKGMLMHDFAYTSDVWHTKEGLTLSSGVLQAKIAVSGKAKHAVLMTAPKMLHTLPIWMETSHKKGYAIYTLVWDEKNVKLYLNNKEIATSKNTLAGEPMHILLRSYLPENQNAGKGTMSVDWVRVYGR
jgi:hypothetical protein